MSPNTARVGHTFLAGWITQTSLPFLQTLSLDAAGKYTPDFPPSHGLGTSVLSDEITQKFGRIVTQENILSRFYGGVSGRIEIRDAL